MNDSIEDFRESRRVPRARAFEFFEPMKSMPSLSHWRDRSQEWSFEQSDVIAFVKTTYDVPSELARVISNVARRAHVIIYDRATQMWAGNPFWSKFPDDKGDFANVLEPRRRHTAREATERVRFSSLPSLKQLSIRKQISAALASGKSKFEVRAMLEQQFSLSWVTAKNLCTGYTPTGEHKR
jgi:hypothetical protein